MIEEWGVVLGRLLDKTLTYRQECTKGLSKKSTYRQKCTKGLSK